MRHKCSLYYSICEVHSILPLRLRLSGGIYSEISFACTARCPVLKKFYIFIQWRLRSTHEQMLLLYSEKSNHKGEKCRCNRSQAIKKEKWVKISPFSQIENSRFILKPFIWSFYSFIIYKIARKIIAGPIRSPPNLVYLFNFATLHAFSIFHVKNQLSVLCTTIYLSFSNITMRRLLN